MGLSATPNTTATDLGAMLSTASTATDKSQTTSSSADTFGNLLSDRLNQEAVRRLADAQSASSRAAARRADVTKKDAAKASAANNDQDARQADRNADAASATSTAASTTQGAQASKAASIDDTQDKTAAAQAAVDPAAQLAAQIEAARQAVQQAAAPVSQPGTQVAAADDAAARLAAGKAGATPTDAAALAALSAANAAAGKLTDPAATVAQPQAAQADALKAAAGKEAQAAKPTPLPDANTVAQALARTRGTTDNTPPAVRHLGSASSSAQGAGSERGSAAHRTEAGQGTQAQAATTATAETARNADTSGNPNTQADAQGAGAKFDGVLTRANGDAVATAPTFTVGGAGTAGSAASAAVTPAQTHTLPTFGDAAWPHSMASQLAYMQVHRQSSAELQLSPAELGGLHVKLEIDNGAVNASFVCQHQAVAELVQDAMPRLRDAMQQGGMELAQTSVSTGDFSQQGASQGSSAQGNGSGGGNGGSSGGNRFAGTQGQAGTGTVAVSTPRVSSHAGAIDTFA
ncbi:flagellar hook-length control protein FliK [Ralstonia pseudosolanacearum]|uniref:Flagellar hook-length control protein n=1 Tax=Ralstonia solanacearum TaxID=305 RepID=A0A0S4TLD3_RALSL|nr:Flagellar hook-length control protein [Ralstonia solanacearum]